jgi:hypothetical protein
MGKGTWPALAVVLLLALAPSASATVRFASPNGATSVSNCTAMQPPCSLERAVNTVAAAGDEVVLAPGDYTVSSVLSVNKTLDIHGTAGTSRPRVVRASPVVFSFGEDATAARLADVQLEAPGQVVTTSALSTGTSLLERLVVLAGASSGGDAVSVSRGWTLRDSTVHTPAPNGVAIRGYYGVMHIVNVTALASDSGGIGIVSDSSIGGICVPPYTVELHAINVIARGGQYDLSMKHLCQEPQSLNVSHSNFRRAKVQANPAGARLEDEGGNQEAEPIFAAPASLDFHELLGSPTIDAGATTTALGATDLDGEPRVQGSAPDIGADEFPPPPPPEPPADTQRPVASLLAVSPAAFRARPAGAARRRAGARISYALDEAATVTFTVKRIVRRVIGHRKRTRYIPVRGSFTDAGEVGGNRIRFSGRLAGKRLRAGRYRLIALPVDAAGNIGNAVLAPFRIVR